MVQVKDDMVKPCDCSAGGDGTTNGFIGEDILRQCVCGNSGNRTNCKCNVKSVIERVPLHREEKGT